MATEIERTRIKMNNSMKDTLHSIAQIFQLDGEIKDIHPLGKGLINDTYFVKTRESIKGTSKNSF
ncbi:hypothetical protein EZS27_023650 [termite gut metagenome]|uniref:Uncharacterized protein n=1 Tax=termite gut metagenome TaxID=433724 RepID=A0A5J4R0X4_9ZZZZ